MPRTTQLAIHFYLTQVRDGTFAEVKSRPDASGLRVDLFFHDVLCLVRNEY